MEKNRYSDEELEEFRQLINEKLQVAEAQYKDIIDTISKRSGNGIDDTLPTYHALEEGSCTQTLDDYLQQAQRLGNFINGLKAALVRIDNKTYGISRVTKKLIPKQPLRAEPHTTLSIEAKLQQKK